MNLLTFFFPLMLSGSANSNYLYIPVYSQMQLLLCVLVVVCLRASFSEV